MFSSSHGLTDKEEGGVIIRTFTGLTKMAFSSRPLFSVLLVGSALTFLVFAILDGSSGGVTTVGITDILQAPPPYKHTLEYLRPIGVRGGRSSVVNTSKVVGAKQEDVGALSSSPPARGRVGISTDQPLLTLFTTFKNRRDRWRIHWNVLRNWSLFQPKVRVILFNDRTEESLLHFAREMNWTILPVPAKSFYGTPLLKHMFFTCQKYVPNSVFYGYANGDILFDRGLIDTLELVSSHLDQLMQSLIIGRRTNFRVRGRRITTMEEVRLLAKTEGKLFRSDAEDYFFLAHNEFPWKAVPNIVIGRPAYDNFLVATAKKYAVAMIDATRTLLALHQTGIDGDFAGHRNRDAHYNARVIGTFDYSKGLTSASQYVTQYTKDGKTELWSRPGVGVPAMLLTPAVTVTAPTNYSVSIPEKEWEEEERRRDVMWLVNNATTDNKTLGSSGDHSRLAAASVTSVPPMVANYTNAETNITMSMGTLENDTGLLANRSNVTEAPVANLLTLFTVFRSNPGLLDTHLNVIKNWAFYHPNVATVLFSDTTDASIDAAARKLNWTILPRVQQTSKVLPLKRMFLQVQEVFPNSKFYGYLNGDLVFGEGLVKTVSAVYRTLEELDNALVVGVKNRYLINEGQYLFDPSEINNIIKVKAAHIHPDFDENFLLAHYMFPWQHIPDLVIGRSVYDNYLVALALRHDFAVVDATRTLMALDQMPSDTTLVQNELEDFDPNLLGALDYTSGFASSAQYETTWGEEGNVRLWRRQKDGKKSLLKSYHRK